MRQTGFSLSDLFDQFNAGFCLIPRCLTVNEIGDYCQEGNKEAEEFLVHLLQDPEEQESLRTIALCFLSVTENLEKASISAVKAFKENPINAQIVQRSGEVMQRKVSVI